MNRKVDLLLVMRLELLSLPISYSPFISQCMQHHLKLISLAPRILIATIVYTQCTYINGSPQNTFVPGLVELAEQKDVFLGGDDFKSGQTKIKSVLVDFLVSAGIKVC